MVGDLLLTDVSYAPKSFVPRHAHDLPYVCWIRKGSYSEPYGRRTRNCRPGMVVFHPAGEFHSETFGEYRVQSFNVELGPEWLYWMRKTGCHPDQPAEFDGGVAVAIAHRLFGELGKRGRDSTIEVERLTADLLLAVLGRGVSQVPAAVPKWLTSTREILEARFQEPLSLRALAAEAGVHPIYLAAVFRRHIGCSMGEYVRRLRFKQIGKLLCQRVPLAEIALSTGFADQSHFTRFLKRFTGMTPGEYRTFLTFKTGA